MSQELLRVEPNRPPFVLYEGGRVYVSVHDAYFREQYRRLRQQVFDAHPDRRRYTGVGFNRTDRRRLTYVLARGVRRPHATGPYLASVVALERFMRRETRWYATYGLTPPQPSRKRLNLGR